MTLLLTETGAPLNGGNINGKVSTTGGKTWSIRNAGWYRVAPGLRPDSGAGSTTAQMWIDSTVWDTDVSFDLTLPANGTALGLYLGTGFAVILKSGDGGGGASAGANLPDGHWVKIVPTADPWSSTQLRTTIESSTTPDQVTTEHATSTAIQWVTGDRMRVTSIGQSVTVYRNGTQVMQIGVAAQPTSKTRTVFRASSPGAFGDWAVANVDISSTAPTLVGATAIINMNANAGFFTTVGGPGTLQGATALIDLSAAPAAISTTGPGVPGDMFANPIVLSPTGGTFIVDLSGSTVQAGEPDANGGTHSVWLSFSPTVAGKLVIHGNEIAYSYVIEHFSGTDLTDLLLVSSASYIVGVSAVEAELVQDVAAIGPHYFRIRSYNLAAGADWSVALSHTFTNRLPELVAEVNTPVIAQTPSNALVSILNADPGESVTFELIGYGIRLTQAADAEGIIQSASVPLPPLSAGTYTLRSTGVSSGRYDTDSIQITFGPLVVPTPPGSNVPVTPVVQAGVRKWVLQDPAPGGETYTFPINPTRMAPPHAPRFVEFEQSTAPNGTTHIWEGARRAHSWSFEGYIETQAFYLKLAAFTALQRRLYLIDHRNRSWVVSLESFDPTPKKNGSNFWAHTYTISALIFSGPEQL